MTQKFIPGQTYPKRGGGSATVARISDRGEIVDTDCCVYWSDGRISRAHEMRGDLLLTEMQDLSFSSVVTATRLEALQEAAKCVWENRHCSAGHMMDQILALTTRIQGEPKS